MARYDQIIDHVFHKNFRPGARRIAFSRDELIVASDDLGFPRIKNLGDIPYSYRFRTRLPESILSLAPKGTEWIITGTGIGQYAFRLASPGKIEPSQNRKVIKIFDATPEIVKRYAPGTDEQALLTKVRYNRLVDLFLGVTCYSIQNHLRTTLAQVGQIEVDEVYLGVGKKGTHYVIPCQAKSPGDHFGIVQVMQDLEFCKQRYPGIIPRPIALQYLTEDDVAILELSITDDQELVRLEVVDERHYRLCTRNSIGDADLQSYLDE